PRLNAGILMSDGGLCILGFMLVRAGHLPITIYGSTLALSDPRAGESAIDAVARAYELPRESVIELARTNDATPRAERVAAVRRKLEALLGSEP
ncbi:MAG TPA: hypothetical protein VEI82_11225, partial [Myxococcota bacterium]|nr:hypothetical protein [Myxococcota bacterium]